jgi:hypothetical protein
MTSKITNDFKQQFGLLITLLNLNYSPGSALNYSSTINRFVIAGLLCDEKIALKYDDATQRWEYIDTDGTMALSGVINKADGYLKDALKKIEIQGRAQWVESQIISLCYESDRLLFPLALSNGLLDLKDACQNALASMNNSGGVEP